MGLIFDQPFLCYNSFMIEVEEFLSTVEGLKGRILLIGAVDTGKTYLSRNLIRKALQRNLKVSLLDLDVGQQSLALPGTIALKNFSREEDLDSDSYDKMIFIGTLNPIERIESIIEGAKYLSLFAEFSDLFLVDTTGLVEGEKGARLKLKKIESLRPERIIAIERENEIEHILEEIKGIEILRLRPSTFVKKRSREERIEYRKMRFKKYFSEENLGNYSLTIKNMKISQIPFMQNIERGRIFGLNIKKETIALGIFEEMNKERIFFRSPIPSERLSSVEELVFGEKGLSLWVY